MNNNIVTGVKGFVAGNLKKYLIFRNKQVIGVSRIPLSEDLGYDELSIDITKNNLREFDADIVYHKGYIPDSLESEPKSPNSISYLHIDLNAVNPTMDVLSFFLPKLSKNGVILFDDYGWDGYLDTKLELDKFFKDQSGLFLKLPTGQAIYFCR